jgi:hypothetical protein
LYQVVLAECASQINSLPVDVNFPQYRNNTFIHPRFPGGEANNTCTDFTWVKVKGKVTAATIRWAGRKTTSAHNCAHSTMSWGLYKKASDGSFSLIGGGSSYGTMPQGEGGSCLYNMQSPTRDWGSFSALTNTNSTAEYRIAFNAWSHDDPNLGHVADDCADPISCFWPIDVTIGGTAGPVPRQDYVTAERVSSSGQWRWLWRFLDNSSLTSDSWTWGNASEAQVIPGDYDGDGRTDTAWSRIQNPVRRVGLLPTSTGAEEQFDWATSSDVPIVGGDYDGDGRTDIASYLPSSAKFSISLSNTQSLSHPIYPSGGAQSRVVAGNYDKDLRTDLATWNATNGWRILESFSGAQKTASWGVAGDIPIAPDFDGDFRTDIAVWRPSEGRFYWISSSSGQGSWYHWGQNGDFPVPAYFDGDAKMDLAIYRPSDSRWWVVSSSTGSGSWTVAGTPNNVPVVPFSR